METPAIDIDYVDRVDLAAGMVGVPTIIDTHSVQLRKSPLSQVEIAISTGTERSIRTAD